MNELDAKIIRMLPSMLWTRMMIHRKGGISLGRIHKELQPGPTSSWKDGSRRLYKNYRGVQITDKTFIEQVENYLPGTKKLLFHPLWDILKNPDANLDEILQYMDRLDFDLKRKIFKVDSQSRLLVRKKLTSFSQIYYVAKENSLDALACLLMLIRESEINKQVQAYIVCKWEAIFLIYRLAMVSPYSDLMPLLHPVVYDLFIEKNNPLPPGFIHDFWDDYPFDRDIPPKVSMHIVKDIYSGVLWNAENRQVISSDPQERLNFLFWIDHFFSKNEVKRALIKLPPGFDITQPSSLFPAPLNEVMAMMRGDSRKYLLRQGNFQF